MNFRNRLKKEFQFEDMYRSGVAVDTASFRVLYRENRRSCSRFAAVVGKRYGPAVHRNRAKRIARSIFREFQSKLCPSCDIILFPKKTMLNHRYHLLSRDFGRAIEQARRENGTS